MAAISRFHDFANSRFSALRHWPGYLAYRGVLAVLRLVPFATAVRLAAAAAYRIGPRRRQHQRALANLAIAFPERTPAEHQRIARDMWANMGRVAAEMLYIDRILATPGAIEVTGQPVVDRYRGKLGSIIAVTLHTGNWELAIWPLAESGQHPAAVYRSFRNPLINAHLMGMRRRLYPGGLFGKGRLDVGGGTQNVGQDTARLIIDHCRRGGRLGFVADHVDKGGIPVPFMGREARFTPVPAMIARRVGSRVWIGRAVRLGSESRFRIEVRELKVFRTDNTGEDVRATTAGMIHQFEVWIREHPEQWMWWNTRFSE